MVLVADWGGEGKRGLGESGRGETAGAKGVARDCSRVGARKIVCKGERNGGTVSATLKEKRRRHCCGGSDTFSGRTSRGRSRTWRQHTKKKRVKRGVRLQKKKNRQRGKKMAGLAAQENERRSRLGKERKGVGHQKGGAKNKRTGLIKRRRNFVPVSERELDRSRRRAAERKYIGQKKKKAAKLRVIHRGGETWKRRTRSTAEHQKTFGENHKVRRHPGKAGACAMRQGLRAGTKRDDERLL